jgi:hypothetical protein
MSDIFLEEIVVFDVALSSVEEHLLLNLNILRYPATNKLFLLLFIHIIKIIELLLLLFIIWIRTRILCSIIICIATIFTSLGLIMFPIQRALLTLSHTVIVLVFHWVEALLFFVLGTLDLLLLEALHQWSNKRWSWNI